MRTQDTSIWAQICQFVFLDLPFVVDGAWRHTEYNANRNHRYDHRRPGARITARPRCLSLGFVLLTITAVFLAYGPTFTALCSVGTSSIYAAATTLVAAIPGIFFVWLVSGLLIRWRDGRRKLPTLRSVLGWAFLGALLLLAIFATIALPFVALDNVDCPSVESHGTAWLQPLVVILTLTVGAAVAQRVSIIGRHWPIAQSTMVWLIATVGWFVLAEDAARESDQVPYQHVFAVFAAVLFVVPVLAELLACWLVAGMRNSVFAGTLRKALPQTELFVRRGSPSELTGIRISHAALNGPIYHPMQLLLLPALAALALPDDWLWPGAFFLLVAAWLLLMWGSISARWQEMVTQVDRWFFTGTPLVISIGVIGIGAARVFGVDYVATVLASTPFGIVVSWITMLYVLFWLLEYAINEPLGAALLRVLNAQALHGYAPYPFTNDKAWNLTEVEFNERYIAVHGAGRFAVVGTYKAEDGREGNAFHTYGFTELFSALAQAADAYPAPGTEMRYPADVLGATTDVGRRIKLYFDLLNATVIVVVIAGVCFVTSFDRRHVTEPLVEASEVSEGTFDLTQVLSGRETAIVLAASGGGTRAALYTEEVLKGLARLRVADKIVLTSGVSGGGVALAYFAAHREELLGAPIVSEPAWRDFREKITKPFIQDVLEGAMEWRIAGAWPLGILLAESLDRRLGPNASFDTPKDIGLLLNTTVAGHPRLDSSLVSGVIASNPKPTRETPCAPYAHLAGGRLVFTNLKQPRGFAPTPHPGARDVRFPYAVVRDPQVRLFFAAALNANFPPVFPNARVDLSPAPPEDCGPHSYYVTDGGVVENLGLISALYALRESLTAIKRSGAAPPSKVHIVAAEASAMDVDYTQDRAIGALGSGKERLAGGLTLELLRDIEVLLPKDALKIHYLPMPLALTSRGGIGTHWMLPRNVKLNDPRAPRPPTLRERFVRWITDDEVELDRDDLSRLLEALHGEPGSFCAGNWPPPEKPALGVTRGWICDRGSNVDIGRAADPHLHAWEQLVHDLK